MAYKYFLYSKDQLDEQNNILAKINKTMIPGTVVVNGVKKQFTQMSSSNTMDRYYDTVVVAEGEESTFTYEKPRKERARV